MENSKSADLSRYWLLLGVAALAVAGLFSLVLVVARTPEISDIPLFSTLFHEALVVHVDLSVLVWFLAIACMMWSLLSARSPDIIPGLEKAALISFGLGALGITASPADPQGSALMSNYIPVITSPVFFMGLSLVFCGVALMVVKLFTSPCILDRSMPTLGFAIASSGVIAVMAGVAFVWSYAQMPKAITGQQYYDLLFWGGGHVLQFLHVQVVMVCWLMLVKALKPGFLMGHMPLVFLFCIGLGFIQIVPFVYMLSSVNSIQHRDFFTQTMMWAGGAAPAIMVLFLIPTLHEAWATGIAYRQAFWSTLAMSILVFAYGGLLGALIHGQNVVIPAHYHGAIVGVTLAFMGVAYLFLPQFGYRDVSGWKLAFWQPVVYGGGQLLHISGLAWSGGYGVLRKTPGGLDDLSMSVKAAMGLMGLGGLIAIIGGFMFVIVVAMSVYGKKSGPVQDSR